MAATDQFYRKQKTLDVVFAVSCILMLVCTVWMFWDDYNRPWKKDQRDLSGCRVIGQSARRPRQAAADCGS